jgi:hypothetical protein
MNYFDLFKSYTIDFTKYLKEQDITLDYYQPKSIVLPELMSTKNWKDVIQEEWLVDYIVPNDSSLDKISYNLYRNVDFWWVILMVNDIESPFDWILKDEEIMALAKILSDNENLYPLRVYQELLFDHYNNRRNVKIINSVYLPNFIKALKEKASK